MEKDIFRGTDNVFLTGNAGTGKSYQLNRYIDSHENVLVTAPTGIAAVNIGGITMHRAFGIPLPACGAKPKDYSDSVAKAVARADTVIIDEISMCRNDVFSFTIKMIRKAEKIKGKKIRIIACGDFSQLPPVVTKSESKLLEKYGFDRSGYAFTTTEWKSCKFRPEALAEVKRQEDKEFIDKLAAIRQGDGSAIDYFNQFVDLFPDDSNAIRICGTNEEASRLNQEYLDSLPGNICAYQAKKEGRVPVGISDEIILLKEGARVIFTANDLKGGRYYNGTFGMIKRLFPDHAVVEVNGEDIYVEKREYPLYNYDAKATVLTKTQIGSIWQMPLKPGKAITIHKSQGQTFDRAVVTPDIFAAGQLYVALSRVRSPQGLVLTKLIQESDLFRNEKVEEFYKSGYGYIKAELPEKKPAGKPAKKTTTKASTKTSAVKKATRKAVKRSGTKTAARKTTVKRKPAVKSKPVKAAAKTKKTQKKSSVNTTRKK